jgi:hypothetical protein
MANVFSDIQQGLDTFLDSIAGLPAIVFENTKYKPTNGVSFIRTNLVTATSRLATVAGQQENPGIYVIDVFTPAEKGPGAHNTIVDDIMSEFQAISKHIIFQGDTEIWINAISRTFPQRTDAWFNGSVDISYTTFTI